LARDINVGAGARAIAVRDIEGPGVSSAIPFGRRGEAAPEERDAPVSPELKEAVLARDGRCVVCGRLEELTPHHLDSHADGGRSDMARLCALCLACQGEVHQGDVVLRVEEDGTVTSLDREGKPLSKPRTAAEVLGEAGEECPLETIARGRIPGPHVPLRQDAASPLEEASSSAREEAAPLPAPVAERSLDGLPVELSAAEWRALEGRLEWSPSHRSFHLLPPAEWMPPGSLSAEEVAEPIPGPGVRPECFDAFVGQRQVVENLLLASRAARARGETLGHVLLEGPAGLGKTTLARLLARESGSRLEEVVAGNMGDPHQLISLLARLRKGAFIFVDEVHGLDAACEECLYPALEDGLVHAVLRESGRTRALRVRLEPFTLVAATTRAGSLSRPFRARFPLRERLDLYGEEDLAEVATRAAVRLGATVSQEAASEVARRSKGTPREAIRLLERARDVAHHRITAEGSPAPVAHVGQTIELAHVGQAAERLGIDENGLDRLEQAAVKLLIERGRPMGVEAMAARLGADLETFREVHEPWLERAGLVERTERGRVATTKAWALYGGSSAEAVALPAQRHR
jgi:Holliday junction DNA helicase RuvB